MEIKVFKMNIKADTDIEGIVEGRASYFDNVDLGGDIVRPGAFAKSLEGRDRWPLLYMHNPLKLIGGAYLEERSKFLFARNMLNLETTDGRDVYAHARAGDIGAMSFGYDVVQSEPDRVKGRDVRVLTEVKLYEVSLLPVGFGMNPKAITTLVKARKGCGKCLQTGHLTDDEKNCNISNNSDNCEPVQGDHSQPAEPLQGKHSEGHHNDATLVLECAKSLDTLSRDMRNFFGGLKNE